MAQKEIYSENDTLIVTVPRPLYSFGPERNGNMTSLISQKLKIPFVNENSVFRFIKLSNVTEPTIKFKKCYMGVLGESSIPKTTEHANDKRLEFDSCTLSYLTLAKQKNETAIYNCHIGVVHVDSSSDYSLTFNDCKVQNTIFIENSRNLKLDLHRIVFSDSGDARIFNSTISKFTFIPSSEKECNVLFTQDTLLNFVLDPLSFEDGILKKRSNRNTQKSDTFSFYNCYINCTFWLFPLPSNLILEFDNCTFGPEADLRDLSVTALIIKNCKFPTNDIPLSINEIYKTQLTIINTDLDHLRLNFTSNIKLSFPDGFNTDVVSNTYQRLLSKFDHEGKSESYKQVDIQYKKFSKTKVGYFLSSIWWYHSYKPQWVFIWTFGVLLLFFLTNLIWWDGMHSTYSIVPWSIVSYYEQDKPQVKLFSTVLLFTILIFFSLKVNFDKLNFNRLKFVYIFLIQYFVGIWCLIFIVRFIIKI